MIATVLAAAYGTFEVKELPVASAKTVSAFVVVRAPQLSRRDLANWFVLGEAILAGSRTYTPRALLEFGAQSGRAPEVRTWVDHMTIQVSAPGGEDGLSVAAGVAMSLAKEPTLEDDDIKSAIRMCEDVRENRIWRSQVSYDLPWDLVTPQAVRQLHAKTFTRKQISCIAWGDFSGAKSREVFESAAGDWNPKSAPYDNDPTGLRPDAKYFGPVTSLELQAQSLASKADLAAGIVALAGLGGGKSGALFQVIRQKMRWSYAQDAYLQPTNQGLVPRLIILYQANDATANRADELRQVVQGAVDGWGDADLARMKRLALGALEGSALWSPILLAPGRLAGAGEFEQAAIDACLSNIPECNRAALADEIRTVDLARAAASARKIVDGSVTQISGQSAK